jgi:hypothetical protein
MYRMTMQKGRKEGDFKMDTGLLWHRRKEIEKKDNPIKQNVQVWAGKLE